MKKLILLLNFAVLLLPFATKAHEISRLEQQGQYLEAMILTLDTYKSVAGTIRFDDFVSVVKTRTEAIRKEIVEKSASKSNTWNTTSSFVNLMAFFSKNKGESFESYDVTKWITANPEETAQAPQKIQQDFNSLKSTVEAYILTHKNELIVLKKLAAKALQLSDQVDDRSFLLYRPILDKTYALASYFEFSGAHMVTKCETEKHVATQTENYYKNKYHFAYATPGGYGERAGVVSSKRSVTTNAYSETGCTTEKNTATTSADKVLHQKFIQIDSILKSWYKQMSARYLSINETPESFTWGR